MNISHFQKKDQSMQSNPSPIESQLTRRWIEGHRVNRATINFVFHLFTMSPSTCKSYLWRGILTHVFINAFSPTEKHSGDSGATKPEKLALCLSSLGFIPSVPSPAPAAWVLFHCNVVPLLGGHVSQRHDEHAVEIPFLFPKNATKCSSFLCRLDYVTLVHIRVV